MQVRIGGHVMYKRRRKSDVWFVSIVALVVTTLVLSSSNHDLGKPQELYIWICWYIAQAMAVAYLILHSPLLHLASDNGHA